MEHKRKHFIRNHHLLQQIPFLLLRLYPFLEKVPVLKQEVHAIKKKHKILHPGREENSRIYTVSLILKSFFLSFFLMAVGIYISDFQPYPVLFIVVFTLLIQKQMLYGGLEKLELKLLYQFEKYIGDIRHDYHLGGSVSEALYDSMENAPAEIVIHIENMLEKWNEESEYGVMEYGEGSPHAFFITFFVICQAVLSFGDTIKDGNSLFLSNLICLKEEMHVELLKREKKIHIFSGLLFLCLFPVFFLEIIEKWSIGNLPELERYYSGPFGIMALTLIFFSSLLSYQSILHLKSNIDFLPEEHWILNKLFHTPFVSFFLSKWMNAHIADVYSLDKKLKDLSVHLTVAEYLLQKCLIGFGTFIVCQLLFIPFGYRFIYFLLSILFSILASFFPWFIMECKKLGLNRNRENEILQYHTMISMLMYIPRMNIEILLAWMESFGFLFRDSVTECADYFLYDEEEALEQLKRKEPFLPFLRIVEDLEACDKVGIEKAFQGLSGQRSYMIEKRKQDNEILISRQGLIGQFLAYIPLTLTLGVYLILPFVMESLSQFVGFINQYETLY